MTLILLVAVAAMFTGMSTAAMEAAKPAASCCDHGGSGGEPAPPCSAPDCPNHPGVSVTLVEPIGLTVFFHEYPFVLPLGTDTPPDIFPDSLFRPPKPAGRYA
jgi:hypothetical protein